MKSVGVIIGRFQVPDLHEGHGHLFRYVLDNHDDVLVIVGSNDGPRNDRYPLPFKAVRDLILDFNKRIEVLPLSDMRSDSQWSQTIDNLISSLYPMRKVVLYGSRDSFIKHYCGRFECNDLQFSSMTSGSKVREEIMGTISNSSDFRRGAIHSIMNLPPRIFMTVDIALIKEGHVLLGRKPGAEKWRFPGGFFDFEDENLEAAARRELHEETGMVCEGGLRFIGSYSINDWRQTKRTKVVTAFFSAQYSWGIPKGSDDLEEVKFFPIKEETIEIITYEHNVLAYALVIDGGKNAGL